jgi:NADPH:quinone reductase-like Zn-dependent oxidoreductase
MIDVALMHLGVTNIHIDQGRGGYGGGMRAVLMTAVGGPDVLELAEVPEPGPPAGRERQRAILEQAAPHFDAGDLRVQVGATFPLEKAADAHRAVESGQVIGKTVLTIG